ncbi:MAG: hypothetical protein HYR56_34840 [Acidobacteria bacterium]|nr:hypothetical protein [Acidobacteriota bacterium]MBI3425520.1 hypothetical protein [Acidobacteriota bacterium]
MQLTIETQVTPNGTVILHDLPFANGEAVQVTVQSLAVTEPAPMQPRIPGLHAGAMQMREDFDEPLPDDFWLGAA